MEGLGRGWGTQVKLDACQLTRGELEEKMQRARHEQERKAAALGGRLGGMGSSDGC